MMNKKLLVTALAASITLGLAGCSDDTDTSGLEQQIADLTAQNDELTQETVALAAKAESYISTFQQQCDNIGIKFDYVDPNASAPAQFAAYGALASSETVHMGIDACLSCHQGKIEADPKHQVRNWKDDKDCQSCHPAQVTNKAESPWGDITFASGANYFYGTASYSDPQFLSQRMNGKTKIWVELENMDPNYLDYYPEAATTLEEACNSPSRENIHTMFPDNGKEHRVYGNSLGVKTIATVREEKDAEGNIVQRPNIAVFGFGLDIDKDTGKQTSGMTISNNNTCQAAVMQGEAVLEYYEYDSLEQVKFERNKGARILVKTDLVGTSLRNAFFQPLEGMDDQTAIDPATVNWDDVAWCSLKFDVDQIVPLG
ncbi:hypothetical protein [Paraferrimonas sedimenticola]|uniref:Cytochrome c-552/4 domain-containing protein n=1 Tax=Paraferrimonas sedimenticola TaxID=375674 RepID=A0AA37RY27_9GAMM|nr:hypothetical protein [Paraferrimonas sedimenticola]GLP97353.1 hypothetical protein GCM10007895_26600 [Paraferrimonas sedimenticola]